MGRSANKLEPELFHTRTVIDPLTGCHEWTGFVQTEGYGQVEIDGVLWLVHRAAWTLFRGTIPSGELVLHTCDNRKCWWPAHLFLGTHKDNWDDMVAKGRHSGRLPLGAQTKRRIRKLTDEQVRAIRAAAGTHASIAARHGVARSIVTEIRLGRRKRLVVG